MPKRYRSTSALSRRTFSRHYLLSANIELLRLGILSSRHCPRPDADDLRTYDAHKDNDTSDYTVENDDHPIWNSDENNYYETVLYPYDNVFGHLHKNHIHNQSRFYCKQQPATICQLEPPDCQQQDYSHKQQPTTVPQLKPFSD